MSDHDTKNGLKEIAAKLREVLVGETVNDVKFPDIDRYGSLDDIKICTLSGRVIRLEPSTEFDRCGDYDGTRLYITIRDESDNLLFDDYLS